MIERAFQIRPEELPEKEVWFAMGYRDSVPDERVRDMVLQLRERLVVIWPFGEDVVDDARVKQGAHDSPPELGRAIP